MDFKISDTNKGKKILIHIDFEKTMHTVLQEIFPATTYLKMRSTYQAVTARNEDKTRTEFAIVCLTCPSDI